MCIPWFLLSCMCVLYLHYHPPQQVREMATLFFGKVEDVDTDFLVDTGASVTVISETLLRRLPNHWNLHQVEVPAGFRLSAASGHHMQLLAGPV